MSVVGQETALIKQKQCAVNIAFGIYRQPSVPSKMF